MLMRVTKLAAAYGPASMIGLHGTFTSIDTLGQLMLAAVVVHQGAQQPGLWLPLCATLPPWGSAQLHAG